MVVGEGRMSEVVVRVKGHRVSEGVGERWR